MSAATIKSTVSGIVTAADATATVDTTRIDPDELPRKIRGTTPYWSISVVEIDDGRGPRRPFGSADRLLFRHYAVRVEGWRGIQADNQTQAAWDLVVEDVCDRLEKATATFAAAVTGYKGHFSVRAPIDIVRLGQNTRAHHAVVTLTVRLFKRLTV